MIARGENPNALISSRRTYWSLTVIMIRFVGPVVSCNVALCVPPVPRTNSISKLSDRLGETSVTAGSLVETPKSTVGPGEVLPCT